MAKQNTRREIEGLIAGESISKKINQELTYRELCTPHLIAVIPFLQQRIRFFKAVIRKHGTDFIICKSKILIDEYDVPLEKAYHAGYYDEMAGLLGNLLSRALKGNESLYFAVLTGCLRVAKESIFTGLNNFKIYSVSDIRFGEYFGFTDDEVRAMLAYYSFEKSPAISS